MPTVSAFTKSLATGHTLTDVQGWGQLISNALLAFGWVQTADTSQINWTTFNPTAINTNGYEMWQMGDTLQATNPIFLKIIYGLGGTTAVWAITFQTGAGSSGAGALTGFVSSAFTMPTTTIDALPIILSGSTNRFAVIMWNVGFFTVERSHTSVGGDTASYYTVVSNNSTSVIQQSVTAAKGPLTAETQGVTFMSASLTTAPCALTKAVAAFYPLVGCVDYPLMNVLCMKATDRLALDTFTVVFYGATRTYIRLPITSITVGSAVAAATVLNAVAMRFD